MSIDKNGEVIEGLPLFDVNRYAYYNKKGKSLRDDSLAAEFNATKAPALVFGGIMSTESCNQFHERFVDILFVFYSVHEDFTFVH